MNDSQTALFNVDAEEAILGGCLFDPYAYDRISQVLQSQHFYVNANQRIFATFKMLADASKQIDILTVSESLESLGLLESAGGRTRLANLYDLCITAVNIDAYAQLVKEKWVRRRILEVGNNLIQSSTDGGLFYEQAIETAEKTIFNLSEYSSPVESRKSMQTVAMEVWQHLESTDNNRVSTAISTLDKLTGGYAPGSLVIVAGRASMGKTQFAVHTAYETAITGDGAVVVFSAEMSATELGCRFVARRTGIDSFAIANKQIRDCDWQTVAVALEDMQKLNLHIDENSNPTPAYVRSQLRRIASGGTKIKIIVLDYLQLVGSGKTENRVQELDLLTREYKTIAKEFNCPFVALAQVNRGVESRQDKRPLLSDLRDSGAIEQAADQVILLYRDDYYNKTGDNDGVIELNVAKNRNGKTGTAECLLDLSTSDFIDKASSMGG